MEEKTKTFWLKTNGEIIDLTKERDTDEFLWKHWYKKHKIISLFRFGKTYQLDIKEGGNDYHNFKSVSIDFRSAKELNVFLDKLKVNLHKKQE